MCNAYNNLSILFFFKTFIMSVTILVPVILMVFATREILKNIITYNVNYVKPLKKMVLSLVILFIPVSINKLSVFDFEVLNCWENANINTLVSLQSGSDLAYVPVVVEPIYIKNPYKIDVDSLKEIVLEVIGDRDVSMSFYSPKAVQGFDINGDKMYIAASVSKVHAVLNLYDYAFENNIDIKNVYMSYIPSDFQTGAGSLQNMSNLKDKSFSLYELCERAIRESDNIAWNMIKRYMSNKRNNVDYYKSLVGSDDVIRNGTSAMTPNWAVTIMKKIYYNKNNNPYYEKLIYDMKLTNRTKLAAGLDTEVAHKVGSLYLEGYLYINDAAIVYSDSEYILSVFTKSKMSEEEISALVSEISLVIYKEVAK